MEILICQRSCEVKLTKYDWNPFRNAGDISHWNIHRKGKKEETRKKQKNPYWRFWPGGKITTYLYIILVQPAISIPLLIVFDQRCNQLLLLYNEILFFFSFYFIYWMSISTWWSNLQVSQVQICFLYEPDFTVLRTFKTIAFLVNFA